MIEWYSLALISAFFSAIAAISEKKTLFKEKALSFSAIFAIFNLFLVIPFFFFIDFQTLSISGLIVLFIKSILAGTAFLCVMNGIKNLELSSALPLLVLTPGLVAIFAFIFLKESLNIKEILGIIFLIIGSYVLLINKNKKIIQSIKEIIKSKGHYSIGLALLLFTTTSILDKIILHKYKVPPTAFMGFQHLFFAIIFIVFLLFVKEKYALKKSLKQSWKLILIVSFATIIYRYSYILAVKSSQSVAMVISLKRLSVFFAAIVGGTLFQERRLIRKLIATIIMLIGAAMIVLA